MFNQILKNRKTNTNKQPASIDTSVFDSPVDSSVVIPSLSRDDLRVGDILEFHYVGLLNEPSMTKVKIETIGLKNDAGFRTSKVTILKNTTKSPLWINEQYWLDCNTKASLTGICLDGTIFKGSYGHFVPTDADGLDGLGTPQIDNVIVIRGKQTIHPFGD